MTDRLEKAFSPSTRIRFAYVDVTVAAKALEARHLCGPTAAMALAQGLIGVALLSADAAAEQEAFMLRATVSGLIGGLLVEATGAGGLRGFTNRKILNTLDDRDRIDTAEAWGRSGSVQIVASMPGRILHQAVIDVNPPLVRFMLARYFNHSMQVPTACAIHARASAGGLLTARGLLAQRMEDSDPDSFVQVLEAFEDRRVAERLERKPVMDHEGVAAFGDILALPDIELRETRPLMFACRCSRERTLAVLETLPTEELEALMSAAESQDITCHMCGKTYTATPAEMSTVLDNRH